MAKVSSDDLLEMGFKLNGDHYLLVRSEYERVEVHIHKTTMSVMRIGEKDSVWRREKLKKRWPPRSAIQELIEEPLWFKS